MSRRVLERDPSDPKRQEVGPLLKLVLELGPLLVFFFANARGEWLLAKFPALAVLGGTTRLLLADAVGLGKTIQAGLVLAETVARGWVERALILTPAALREGWADELERRFGLSALVLDHERLRRLRTGLPRAVNPWADAPIVVSSIDLVKRVEVRAAVEDSLLDLLIVDEAHHVTPATDRGALVERLARRTPWLVLASATPHTGDRGRFRYLLDLGRVGPREPRMRAFRRSRLDVGIRSVRRVHVLRVATTPAEARLQSAIREYAQAVAREAAPGIRLVGEVVARRATSSALAVERTLARRLALLSREAVEAERVARVRGDHALELRDAVTCHAPPPSPSSRSSSIAGTRGRSRTSLRAPCRRAGRGRSGGGSPASTSAAGRAP